MNRSVVVMCVLSIIALLGCSSEQESARVVITVRSDLSVPEELDRVTLEADGQSYEGSAEADLRVRPLPRAITLLHESGPLGPVRVRVRGFRGQQLVVSKELAVWFVPRREAEVEVMLQRDCVSVACEAGETCELGACVPIRDEDPGLDAGADAGDPSDGGDRDAGERDAGGPDASASDAKVASDANTPDAAGKTDASSDGGRGDANDAATDAGGAGDSGSDAGDAGTVPPGPGSRPVCTINRPVQNDLVQTNVSVTFRGGCTDPETGVVTSGLAWSSQLDGLLASGAETTGAFRSEGVHRLSLCAPDPREASLVGCGSIELEATATPQPSARILSVVQGDSSNPPYRTGPPIVLTGSGTGASVTLSWHDSLQGPLGTGGTATLRDPAAGAHTVTLTVRDRDGNEGIATTSFIVLERIRANDPAP